MLTKSGITRILLIIGVIAVLSSNSRAQEPAGKPIVPSIQVSSEAIVTGKPDHADIDIGVVTQAQTAQAAASRNAEQLNAVLTELRKVVPQSSDLKTISYSVNPDYRYPGGGGKPTIVGYTANNILRVPVSDLTLVGKVIDVATQSGANSVHRLQFRIKDERTVQAMALREAAIKARSQAEALAGALGLKVVRVLSVKETEPVTRPFRDTAMMARAEGVAVTTPIESGTIEVRAVITLSVEVSPL
jgi:uncharacterized protein YggE